MDALPTVDIKCLCADTCSFYENALKKSRRALTRTSSAERPLPVKCGILLLLLLLLDTVFVLVSGCVGTQKHAADGTIRLLVNAVRFLQRQSPSYNPGVPSEAFSVGCFREGTSANAFTRRTPKLLCSER